jgi:hypothetical protein
LAGGSAKDESGHALKICVGTAERHTKLRGQCGNPEIVGRNTRARLTELQKDPVGAADDFDPNRHAAQEVAAGVGIERDDYLLPNFCVDLVKRPDRGVERRVFAPRTDQGIEIMMSAVPVGSLAVPIRGEPSGESRHFRVGKALNRVLDFSDGAHARQRADIACWFKSRFGARGRWRGFRAILKRNGAGVADSTAVAGTAEGVSALQPRLRKVTVRSAARAVSMSSIQP